MRNSCLDIDVKDLSGNDGVDILLKKLKSLYLKDVNQMAFLNYENFEKLNRPKTMSVNDYINEFERRYFKIKCCKMELPDGVLAYRLLKSSNINVEKEQLARATIGELTYENMKKQLKSIFDYCTDIGVGEIKKEDRDEIKVEEEEVLFNSSNFGRQRWRKPRYNQRGFAQPQRMSQPSRGGRKTNPPDRFGNPSTCAICKSIFHWANACPDSHEARRDRESEKVTLFSEEIQECYLQKFLGESLNHGILDSGCTQNVCGKVWLDCFLMTLNSLDRSSVFEDSSNVSFRFGSGPVHKSNRCVSLPVYIGGKRLIIKTEVVDCELPLLLSKDFMKQTDTKIDFAADKATILGKDISLYFTTSGHYAIPIVETKFVLLSDCVLTGKTRQQKYQLVSKLHKQFGHPPGEKLLKLVKDSGVDDEQLIDILKGYENECDICLRYRKPGLRPVVGVSLSKEFNDVVSMDLKTINGKLLLHMIDHATRYSAGTFVKSKEKEEIIDKIFKFWIAIFGVPKKFLSDNGGEFNNDMFRDMADYLNVTVMTTAAEAPWSNGITERHNAIIANMMEKISADTSCSNDVALAWALSAKNALQNVYGYSPNQLVFGRNPNNPCVLNDKPPSLEGITTSELIAEHLNSLHAARRAFVASESSQKIRRALRHQVRPSTSLIFEQGDSVFYKRNDSNKWRGPGVVIGKDNHQVFVKHGGVYVRVHPCHLRHEKNIPTAVSISNAASSRPKVPKPLSNETFEDSVSSIDKLFDTECDKNEGENEPSVTDDLGSCQNDEFGNKTLENAFPEKGNRITYTCSENLDDTEWHEGIVLGRAGKATGINRFWVNVKDCKDGTLKSLNLEAVEWKKIEEVLITRLSNKREPEALEISEAKIKEISNWKDHNVFMEVEDNDQLCVSVRWVITEKIKNGVSCVKARLVARGFEEQALDQLRKDSPTCCKENLRLVLTLISTFGWRLHSLDVKSAFLQGRSIDRDVFLKPPPEAGSDKLWKLRTTVYGLCDAPRVWYLRIKEELLCCGCIMSSCDEAVFFWRQNSKLGGVICCHVDDFCWGGTEQFQASVINVIRLKFQISTEDHDIFRYVGLDLEQSDSEIKMHQQEYIAEIEQLVITRKERQKSDLLEDSEIKQLRGIAGQLNWAANQTRPDIAFNACEISVAQKNGTVEDLFRANKSIKKLKSEQLCLRFPNLGNIKKLCLLAFSDASLANLRDSGSQGGFIVFLIGDNGNLAPLLWQSKKIRCVVKSTISAEALALLESAEACCLLRTILCEILGLNTTAVPIHCVVDNKSLYDTVYSTKTLVDKRFKIDVCVLRDMLSRGEIKNIEWTDSQSQLADCLTKTGASSASLLKILNGGKLFCQYCNKSCD